MPGIPSFDPLDESMSGRDADPQLVVAEVLKVYRELQARYDAAKFGGDLVGRRALGECCDAISDVLERWAETAAADGHT